MKHLVTLALALGLTLAAGLGPAWAGGGFHGQSVFPRTPDPWKHWGRPHGHSFGRFGHPHPGFRARPGSVIVVPGGTVFVPAPHGVKKGHGFFPIGPVWIPGRWAWNGFGWVWVPGHWR